MNKKIQIYIVSHDENDIKSMSSDEIYTPLFVGRDGKDNLGFISDDTGENISYKNSTFCELTGLYWMWKNSDADIIGLVHYRRNFTKSKLGKRLEKADLDKIFQDYDIILPKRAKVLLGSVYKDYDHWNYSKDLDLCEQAIKELSPEYLENYQNTIINGDSLYYYNMFIAPKEIIDKYCEWVFPILFHVEKNIDTTGYNDYQKRVYGFLTERLFDVWMDRQDLKVKESDIMIDGFKLNLKMWIMKRWIVRKIYVGLLNAGLLKKLGRR